MCLSGSLIPEPTPWTSYNSGPVSLHSTARSFPRLSVIVPLWYPSSPRGKGMPMFRLYSRFAAASRVRLGVRGFSGSAIQRFMVHGSGGAGGVPPVFSYSRPFTEGAWAVVMRRSRPTALHQTHLLCAYTEFFLKPAEK